MSALTKKMNFAVAEDDGDIHQKCINVGCPGELSRKNVMKNSIRKIDKVYRIVHFFQCDKCGNTFSVVGKAQTRQAYVTWKKAVHALGRKHREALQNFNLLAKNISR